MANNSEKRAVHFMVYGVNPPHDPNVLWMDTSVDEAPVLKIFLKGVWTCVHTMSEQDFYRELNKKLNITDFYREAAAINTKIDNVDNKIDNATGQIEQELTAIQDTVNEQSLGIDALNERVAHLRVLKQEIVTSLEDITDPDISTIYLILDESGEFYNSYIYVEETDSFSLLGSNDIPVINVTNLNDLNSYITPGLYNVVYNVSAAAIRRVSFPYLLLVKYEGRMRPVRKEYYTQILYGGENILYRTADAPREGETIEWSEWTTKDLAFTNDIATAKEELKEELLPLIYAGL